jgi:hypothetical protein
MQKDWGQCSSGTAFAYQIWDPEFNPQYQRKKKKEEEKTKEIPNMFSD